MKMEGIMNFTDEVAILRCVSVSFLLVVNERQYKGILDDMEEQTWKEMSEDWIAFLAERCTSPTV